MLVWRFFSKQRVVHFAIIVLLSSAIVVLALYGAYLARQAELLTTRLEPQVGEGYILVIEQQPRNPANLPPFRGMQEPPVLFSNTWVREVVPSSLGSVLFSLVSQSALPGMTLNASEAALPESFATRYGLSLGSVITAHLPQGERQLQVKHFHDAKLFGESIVVRAEAGSLATHMLYETRSKEPLAEVIRYMRRVYPTSRIEDITTVGTLATDITRASYSPGARARVELVTFITIAYLSTSLLAFLDRRKVLAVLKAMGLMSMELMKIIAGENSLSPLAAAVLGGSLSFGVLWWLSRVGYLSAPNFALILGAIAGILPAVIIAIAVPARLAQQATVNQLLFERPIPMIYGQVKGLNRRYPALDPKIEQGIKFVKLDVIDGEFPGFVFRKLGDFVKAGEVLAVMHDWAGLRVREYIAPITGEIVHYHQEGGFIGIRPRQEELSERCSNIH